MFLVDLSTLTIKEKTESIEKQQKMKSLALDKSSKQLEEDTIKLNNYIAQDNKTTA